MYGVLVPLPCWLAGTIQLAGILPEDRVQVAIPVGAVPE
jgi:hypothetical protein